MKSDIYIGVVVVSIVTIIGGAHSQRYEMILLGTVLAILAMLRMIILLDE